MACFEPGSNSSLQRFEKHRDSCTSTPRNRILLYGMTWLVFPVLLQGTVTRLTSCRYRTDQLSSGLPSAVDTNRYTTLEVVLIHCAIFFPPTRPLAQRPGTPLGAQADQVERSYPERTRCVLPRGSTVPDTLKDEMRCCTKCN